MKTITVTIELCDDDAKFLATNSLERVMKAPKFVRAFKHDEEVEYERLARISSQLWYAASSSCLADGE